MKRYLTFVLALGGGTILQAIVPVPTEVLPVSLPQSKPRSVVFFLANDHRYDAMSFLGYPFAKTPVMDSKRSTPTQIRRFLSRRSPSSQTLKEAMFYLKIV